MCATVHEQSARARPNNTSIPLPCVSSKATGGAKGRVGSSRTMSRNPKVKSESQSQEMSRVRAPIHALWEGGRKRASMGLQRNAVRHQPSRCARKKNTPREFLKKFRFHPNPFCPWEEPGGASPQMGLGHGGYGRLPLPPSPPRKQAPGGAGGSNNARRRTKFTSRISKNDSLPQLLS